MNENLMPIETIDAFRQWNESVPDVPTLKGKQAKAVFGELISHRIALFTDASATLYWKEAGMDAVRISFDDMIDQVCEINYRDILDYRALCMNSNSYREFCEHDDRLSEIKKVGKILDKVFDMTVYGRQINNQMKQLAEKAYHNSRMIPVYDLPMYEDKVINNPVPDPPRVPESQVFVAPPREEKGKVI